MAGRSSVGTMRYIGKRLLQTIIVWFAIITLNFILFRIMPGDPRQALIGEGMSPELRLVIVERFGLDRPLIEQYFLYIWNLFNGDMGISFSHFGENVWDTIFAFRPIESIWRIVLSLIIQSDYSLLCK